jgi:serine/threonine protein phosphatase PrpC
VIERVTPPEIATVERASRYNPFEGSSPCGTDEKDQDRVRVSQRGSSTFAAVCDGATQSIHSAEAAEILCSNPDQLWDDEGLAQRVALLLQRRGELIAGGSPVPTDDTYLSRAFVDIVRDKQRHAFQTTLVAVHVTPDAAGRMRLEAKTCGDSALLVFDRLGHLVRSNLQIEDESSSFGHVSPLTEVLPDHFYGEEPNVVATIDADAHIVLCSDGFYDAFPNPSALFRWLLLNGTRPTLALAELHTQLDRNRGDDDISFVWLCPFPDEAPAPKPLRADPPLPQPMLAAFAALFRRWFRRVAHVAPMIPGGSGA